MSISHGPHYLGDDAIYLAKLAKNPPPRYSLDYTATDGDDKNFRPQIEIKATIGYDLDGTAIHVRTADVHEVVMYARPDFTQGYDVPMSDRDLKGHAAFVKAQAAADEAWQSRAFDAAQDAETARRCGDDC